MKLTILGSGTNLHPTRAGAGYLVETDSYFLLDFGPRTLMHLLKTGIDRHRLTHVFFSHFHADHFSDVITYLFDEVYHSRHVAPRPDLVIVGPRGTQTLFDAIISTFPSFDKGTFRVHLQEVSEEPVEIGGTTIRPRPVEHSPGLPCLGYRIEYDGRVLMYSGDAQSCANLIRLAEGADLAVLDCSFPAPQRVPGHMTAEDCGRVARDAQCRHLVLSHFYPPADQHDVRAQAGEAFAGRITKARDVMTLRVGPPTDSRRSRSSSARPTTP